MKKNQLYFLLCAAIISLVCILGFSELPPPRSAHAAPPAGYAGYQLRNSDGTVTLSTCGTSGSLVPCYSTVSSAISTAVSGLVPNTRTVNGHALSSNVTVTASDVGAPATLFYHAANAGNTTTTETDLYSDTIATNTLATNGDIIDAVYAGSWISGTSTKQLRIYFATDVIFDTGALSLSLSSAWVADVHIVRESSSQYRATVALTTEGAALAAYTSISGSGGKNWATTNVLKITGQAAGVGAATNDIIAQMGTVRFFPHP